MDSNHDSKVGYPASNYLIQAEAARRMWEEMHTSYPLVPVPDPPGPRPAWWRRRARRRWQRIVDERRAAKAWNFGALYGRSATPQRGDEVIILFDQFPWTKDAWDQMFPPGKRCVTKVTHKPTSPC